MPAVVMLAEGRPAIAKSGVFGGSGRNVEAGVKSWWEKNTAVISRLAGMVSWPPTTPARIADGRRLMFAI